MKPLRRSLSIVAAVLLLVSAIVLQQRSAQTPPAVFDDMLSNNLATTSVTRVVSQGSAALNITQYTQLNFGAVPTAHALTIFKQNGGKIVTEEISNKQNDFVRYQNIVATHKTAAGKIVDVSSVVGKWAKLGADGGLGSTVTSGLFDQSLLGILPIANLDASHRAELLAYIRANNVFSYDHSKVKTATVDGRKVYQYAVSIKPAPYIALMQRFGALIGAKQYANLNPNDYARVANIPATISVDTRSHELVQVAQASNGHVESYSGYGVVSRTVLPHATLTIAELEKRISALQ